MRIKKLINCNQNATFTASLQKTLSPQIENYPFRFFKPKI